MKMMKGTEDHQEMKEMVLETVVHLKEMAGVTKHHLQRNVILGEIEHHQERTEHLQERTEILEAHQGMTAGALQGMTEMAGEIEVHQEMIEIAEDLVIGGVIEALQGMTEVHLEMKMDGEEVHHEMTKTEMMTGGVGVHQERTEILEAHQGMNGGEEEIEGHQEMTEDLHERKVVDGETGKEAKGMMIEESGDEIETLEVHHQGMIGVPHQEMIEAHLQGMTEEVVHGEVVEVVTLREGANGVHLLGVVIHGEIEPLTGERKTLDLEMTEGHHHQEMKEEVHHLVIGVGMHGEEEVVPVSINIFTSVHWIMV